MMQETETSGSDTRFLLLHGAGLGHWIWERVVPELDAPAEALDLPGRGDGSRPGDVTLKQCIDFVSGIIRRRSIIVGHSLSAEIAVGVAAAHPQKVAALVLVGGLVPESGRSFMSLLPLPQRLFLHVVLRLSRCGVKLPASLVREGYCNDLDDVTTELVLERMVPEAPRLYMDPLTWPVLPDSIPRFYVKLLNDRSATPTQQDQIIERIQATDVESLRTGHLPMLGHPGELAATLHRIIGKI